MSQYTTLNVYLECTGSYTTATSLGGIHKIQYIDPKSTPELINRLGSTSVYLGTLSTKTLRLIVLVIITLLVAIRVHSATAVAIEDEQTNKYCCSIFN
jgi:hypothetical protein